ncbi:hypothetical protein [Ornithinibacillus halophilus]|uniref:Uncharacterized protein n=1 Tax=Ornithinibacillus halophilus TaxID=930117 RepID=A0A1M5L7L2_9BACI|nr:hypothetical protein [Ornithinibacillus halophilus]SHG61001.1 hypothetical protein SAMN05216225_10451 [Ornithinibacillus halophilus]
MHIQKNYPLVFDFLASTVKEESAEIKDFIKQKVDPIYENGTKIIYQDIDYSKFRDDIDIEKAIEILNWTMFGFGDKAIEQINTFKDIGDFGEQYLKEWEKYSELLKMSFYK